MTDYSKMTQSDFDRILAEVMDEEIKPSALLTIPELYEVVSEHYNNAVLEKWAAEQEAE